jgi:hypothetical protein
MDKTLATVSGKSRELIAGYIRKIGNTERALKN